MNSFNKLRWKLAIRTAPRRILCVFGHKWGEPDYSFIDGPIMRDDGSLVPPREREWMVLDFSRQCDRCYVIRSLPHSAADDAAAIEREIVDEEVNG